LTSKPAGKPGGPDDADRPAKKAAHNDGAREADAADGADGADAADGERQATAPWHFKFIVVGSVVYLGWRLYQGISWLAHHL
jgi:hypothetical protein